MQKSFYCPICGAYQKQVDLTETDNTFVCDKCETTIHIAKLCGSGIQEYTELVSDKASSNHK